MQTRLKALLHPELADVLGAAVIGLVLRLVQARLLRLVDAPDIANHVAGEFAVGVAAKQPRLDLHPRKTVALRCKFGHFLVTQAGAQRHGLEAPGFFAQPLEAAPIARRDVHHLRQGVNRLLQVAGFGRRYFQGVGRVVGGQHNAVAVQDQAPVGHDGHDRGAVALGLLPQIIMAHHLQVDQARGHQSEAQQHHHAGHQHPQPKA